MSSAFHIRLENLLSEINQNNSNGVQEILKFVANEIDAVIAGDARREDRPAFHANFAAQLRALASSPYVVKPYVAVYPAPVAESVEF